MIQKNISEKKTFSPALLQFYFMTSLRTRSTQHFPFRVWTRIIKQAFQTAGGNTELYNNKKLNLEYSSFLIWLKSKHLHNIWMLTLNETQPKDNCHLEFKCILLEEEQWLFSHFLLCSATFWTWLFLLLLAYIPLPAASSGRSGETLVEVCSVCRFIPEGGIYVVVIKQPLQMLTGIFKTVVVAVFQICNPQPVL